MVNRKSEIAVVMSALIASSGGARFTIHDSRFTVFQ
jgi:hypothetical protein